MNLQTVWKQFQLKRMFKNNNISVCFEEVIHYYNKLFEDKRSQKQKTETFNDSEKYKQYVKATKTNFVVQTLKTKNYDFINRKEFCTISQLTKDVPIEFILRQLLRQYPKNVFNIFDSQIDEEFFKILSRLPTEIIGILVDSCSIGNSFPKYIKEHINTQKLLSIKIVSDPIDNKGLKKLFSLNLPELSFILLFNLNSTPDIWNVMQKINTRTGLQYVSNLQTNLHFFIIKITSHIYKRISSCKFKSYFKDTFIYLNEFSKIQLKPTQSNRVEIIIMKKGMDIIQKNLTPPAVFDFLEKMKIHVQ